MSTRIPRASEVVVICVPLTDARQQRYTCINHSWVGRSVTQRYSASGPWTHRTLYCGCGARRYEVLP